MELRQLGDVFAAVATAQVSEGLFGILTTHSESYDFGSRADLPGFRVPATAAEASKARFVAAYPPVNADPPLYEPYPSQTFALRQGFGGADNTPFSATVHLTAPSVTPNPVIPSGALLLAHTGGVYTIPSGLYIDNAGLVAGAPVIVANTAEDGAANAGKLKYQAAVDSRVIGYVIEKTSDGYLTVKIGV